MTHKSRGTGDELEHLPKDQANDGGEEEAHRIVLCRTPVGDHEPPEIDGELLLNRLSKHGVKSQRL